MSGSALSSVVGMKMAILLAFIVLLTPIRGLVGPLGAHAQKGCAVGFTGRRCDKCASGYGPRYPNCCPQSCGGYGTCTSTTCSCKSGYGPSFPNCCTSSCASEYCTGNNVCPTWQLTWSDEFNTFDTSKWEYQRYDGCQYGICGWGNNEYQWYTARPDNVEVSNGRLIIRAKKETDPAVLQWMVDDCFSECSTRCIADGNVPGQPQFDWCMGDCGNARCAGVQNRAITSGRIRTYGKFSIAPSATQSVKIEASIKLPQGSGLWPAFWMLSQENKYGGWASSGEIDIMESANDMHDIHGTIHFGSQWPNNTYLGTTTSRNADGSGGPTTFQNFTLIWKQKEMKWYVDGRHFATQKSAEGVITNPPTGWYSTGPGAVADSPFDQPFHLLLNVAVGGWFTGPVGLEAAQNTLTAGPQEMQVDYVRVYTMSV